MASTVVYFDLTYTRLECRVYDNHISIIDSYTVKDDFEKKYVIEHLLESFPRFKEHRTVKGMIREWKAHNILYQHEIAPDRTKTTDLEYKQKLIYKIGYFLISLLFKEKGV